MLLATDKIAKEWAVFMIFGWMPDLMKLWVAVDGDVNFFKSFVSLSSLFGIYVAIN